MILGLCGSSGSGKSTVAHIFSENGFFVLDCDMIYHELVSARTPCLSAIEREFGREVIKDNTLNRSILRKIVFSDKFKLERLNQISHHFVKLELTSRINSLREEGMKLFLIDAPMLFEANLEKSCDFVLGVVSTPESQIARICKRDGITIEAAKMRLSNQHTKSYLEERCDAIIENNGDLLELENRCLTVLERIKQNL